MKVLVIGGNRFFGKKLVQILINHKYSVTLLSRGSLDDGFGDAIKRIICDRTNHKKLKESLDGKKWDIVYDQVCFDYEQAKKICEILNGKTKQLIFTSTVSVYSYGRLQKESVFNPKNYQISKFVTTNDNYGEAKMQAEAALYKYADFPVTSVRFPIVWGEDDWTGRLDEHINIIKSGEFINFPNKLARMSFITSNSAASALFDLGSFQINNPINIAHPKDLQLAAFSKIIEETLKIKSSGFKSIIKSRYGITQDWSMDCSYMENLGLEVEDIEKWLKSYLNSKYQLKQ